MWKTKYTNIKTLTRLPCTRLCPSSLYSDLSSFLFPLRRKHSIWTGFEKWSTKTNKNKSWEEHNWFADRERETVIYKPPETEEREREWERLKEREREREGAEAEGVCVTSVYSRTSIFFFCVTFQTRLSIDDKMQKGSWHAREQGLGYRTVPLCSQGEVVLQHGVENGVVSVDLLLFCSFSSSASSLRWRYRRVRQVDEGKEWKNKGNHNWLLRIS